MKKLKNNKIKVHVYKYRKTFSGKALNVQTSSHNFTDTLINFFNILKIFFPHFGDPLRHLPYATVDDSYIALICFSSSLSYERH